MAGAHSPVEFRLGSPLPQRELAASRRLDLRLSPPPPLGRDGTLGGGRRHLTHLKSRSRPWLWLAKRTKASMAPTHGHASRRVHPSVLWGSAGPRGQSRSGYPRSGWGRASPSAHTGVDTPSEARRFRFPVGTGSSGY